jgi:hypothetical protein
MSLFITTDEAERRIESSVNLLNKISINNSPEPPDPNNTDLEDVLRESIQGLEQEVPPRLSTATDAEGVENPLHELPAPDNLVQIIGRKKREVTHPVLDNGQKEIIGTTARLMGGNKAAEMFQVTPHVAHMFSVGMYCKSEGRATKAQRAVNPELSDGWVRDEELKEHIDGNVMTARDRAVDKLLSAIGLITDEKMDKCKAPELSRIAADMSRVVEKTAPKQVNSGVQVLVYAPTIKKEENYEVVQT